MKKLTPEELLIILEDAKELQDEMSNFTVNLLVDDDELDYNMACSIFFLIKISDLQQEIDKLKHNSNISDILE
jgi:hypothetical protein